MKRALPPAFAARANPCASLRPQARLPPRLPATWPPSPSRSWPSGFRSGHLFRGALPDCPNAASSLLTPHPVQPQILGAAQAGGLVWAWLVVWVTEQVDAFPH